MFYLSILLIVVASLQHNLSNLEYKWKILKFKL